MSNPSPDLVLINHGSVYVLEPLTERGRDWIDESIDPEAQWWGKGVVIEPRYVENVVLGAQASCLVVGG